MARHSQQVWIDCTPEELFEVLMDPDANRHWQTGVVRTTADTPGLAGVGTTMTEVRELAGCRATIGYRLVELDWPHRAVVDLIDGPLRGTASYTCRAVAGGTLFVATSDVTASGRWRVAARAAGALLRTELAVSCTRLKSLIEDTPVRVPSTAGRLLTATA